MCDRKELTPTRFLVYKWRSPLVSSKQNWILQLQQKIEALNQSNLEKDSFLSTASHELRNPITNILMAVQMLKKAPTKERIQRYLEVLQAESNRELELIDDLRRSLAARREQFRIDVGSQDRRAAQRHDPSYKRSRMDSIYSSISHFLSTD
ncbi:MAG: hypothetical protein HC833_00135 [Leptolyngbyaceae cyanobacterium RM1_406_9]|nr:hypothetical protein [Leptolyngbyaceae cyanobacterium RM1_406_9]